MPKDLSDTKGVPQREPRYSESVPGLTYDHGIARYRLCGPNGSAIVQPYVMHWFTPPSGKNNYPMGCLSFNPETEEFDDDKHCPACDEGSISKSRSYWMHAIDRIVQAQTNRSPIVVAKLTGDMLSDIKALQENPAWGNPADPQRGYDLTTTRFQEKNRVKYTTVPQPQTVLQPVELEILNNPAYFYDLQAMCDFPTYADMILAVCTSIQKGQQWLFEMLKKYQNWGLIDTKAVESVQRRWEHILKKYPNQYYASETSASPGYASGVPEPPPPPPQANASVPPPPPHPPQANTAPPPPPPAPQANASAPPPPPVNAAPPPPPAPQVNTAPPPPPPAPQANVSAPPPQANTAAPPPQASAPPPPQANTAAPQANTPTPENLPPAPQGVVPPPPPPGQEVKKENAPAGDNPFAAEGDFDL